MEKLRLSSPIQSLQRRTGAQNAVCTNESKYKHLDRDSKGNLKHHYQHVSMQCSYISEHNYCYIVVVVDISFWVAFKRP